ncbi:MAG: Zn-ribbon domain-containing OB-fold protein [Deltaproteobacteria bacterium]|nr:Zn-ribbon domain-containing OB-fold protein [Deltaproteobacteria bacterium]
MLSFNPSILTLCSTEDGQPHLVGSRCHSCGTVYFPQQTLCIECLQEGTLKEHPLSRRGKLYSFTIVERESLAPPGFKVPYAYGYVELPEGVRVLSKIIGWKPGTLKMGAGVELVVEEIREDSSGQKIMGFRFQLV